MPLFKFLGTFTEANYVPDDSLSGTCIKNNNNNNIIIFSLIFLIQAKKGQVQFSELLIYVDPIKRRKDTKRVTQKRKGNKIYFSNLFFFYLLYRNHK